MTGRTEKDSMGLVTVPENALYGAQTQRALANFTLSDKALPREFITALIQIKKAAAEANGQLGQLDPAIATRLTQAADQLLAREDLMDHFPVPLLQTGSGTSSNMNANEVIARLAVLNGGADPIHPNDHVNRGQSSNDVIPTALYVSTALAYVHQLKPALNALDAGLGQKAAALAGITKTGRTHLMDAVPIRFDQVIKAWQAQIRHAAKALSDSAARLLSLPIGGTAVGTGVNSHPQFGPAVAAIVSRETGVIFTANPTPLEQMASHDRLVGHMGAIMVGVAALTKIANDLRWMNSGPHAGLGEIALPALQPGSSIMPGKVNPVIPEAVLMGMAKITGLQTTVQVAATSGSFELNVMLPLLADTMLEATHLLSACATDLYTKAIKGFTVREEATAQKLSKNPILATALAPEIGYEKAAEIVKIAEQTDRPLLAVALERTDLGEEQLRLLLDPARMTGEP